MAISANVRYRKLKKTQETGAFWHNFREAEYTDMQVNRAKKQNLKQYIDPAKYSQNRYFSWENDKLVQTQPSRQKDDIQGIKQGMESEVKSIYESFTTKNGRKKTLRKNTCLISEFVIYFGSDRPRTGSADGGLNADELAKIRETDGVEQVQNFCKQLSEKYHFRDFKVVCHRDEKTPHWHILCTQIDEKTGELATLKGGRKAIKQQLINFGSDLQDMVSSSFSDLGFVRGQRNSKATHKTLAEMHAEAEMEAKVKAQAEQEIEAKKQELKQLEQEQKERLEAENKEFYFKKWQAEQELNQKIETKKQEKEQKKQEVQELSQYKTNLEGEIQKAQNELNSIQQGIINLTLGRQELDATLTKKVNSIWAQNTVTEVGLFGKETIKYNIPKIKQETLKLVKLGLGTHIQLQEYQKALDDNKIYRETFGTPNFARDRWEYLQKFEKEHSEIARSYRDKNIQLQQQLEQEQKERKKEKEKLELELREKEQIAKNNEIKYQNMLKQYKELQLKYEPSSDIYDLSL